MKMDHENPGAAIYYGRKDDTPIMYNGDKTNPLLMENAIRQPLIVKQVIVVGRNCQRTGCLVTLDEERPRSLSPDEIVSAVREAVDRANKECLKHSFILPQMIKILPPSTFLPTTDKSIVMRKKAEFDLKDVIDSLYEGLFK